MTGLEIDPSVVRPGYIPLIITIVLAAAIVLLFVSMRRQFRRISAPWADEIEGSAGEGSATDESGRGSGATRSSASGTSTDARDRVEPR